MLTTTPADMATFTNNDTRVSQSKTTNTSWSSAATSSAMPCVLNSLHELRTGVGDRCGVGYSLLSPIQNLLSPWPIPRLPRWVDRVNEPLTKGELDAVRLCAKRGRPWGDESWVESIVNRLNWKPQCALGDVQNSYTQPESMKKRPDPFEFLVDDKVRFFDAWLDEYIPHAKDVVWGHSTLRGGSHLLQQGLCPHRSVPTGPARWPWDSLAGMGSLAVHNCAPGVGS